jgi:hypothetical protein
VIFSPACSIRTYKYSEPIAAKGAVCKDIDQAIAQFSHTISIQWYKMAQ